MGSDREQIVTIIPSGFVEKPLHPIVNIHWRQDTLTGPGCWMEFIGLSGEKPCQESSYFQGWVFFFFMAERIYLLCR